MSADFATLEGWLAYIEGLHSRPIEMGLERVRQVRDALGAHSGAAVITVGGTNGKGSTCAMLESILLAAGYSVGVYSSPHLIDYNERVRINRINASDVQLCASFAALEAARGDVPLTYFEFGTLGAWWLFCQQNVDVIILEVGLGGRLDAVNVFEPDCSIVTSVAMDHMDYLGDTREKIGFEKAGIYRAGKPAICGDPNPPETLLAHAAEIGADLRVMGREFGYSTDKQQWKFIGRRASRGGLAYPALRGSHQLLNASSVLAALEAIEERLPVQMQAVREGLMTVELSARFQVLPGRPTSILDVAHNPQAAAMLADNLAGMGFYRKTWAVCGMLSDKDIKGSLACLLPHIDHWLLSDLPGPRGSRAQALEAILQELGSKARIELFASPHDAFAAAREQAGEDDRIVTFGSFLTVADVLRFVAQHR